MSQPVPVSISYHPSARWGGIDARTVMTRVLDSTSVSYYIDEQSTESYLNLVIESQSRHLKFEKTQQQRIMHDQMMRVFSMWTKDQTLEEKQALGITNKFEVSPATLKVYQQTLGRMDLNSELAPWPRDEIPAIRLVDSKWLYGLCLREVFGKFLEQGILPDNFDAKTTDDLATVFLHAGEEVTPIKGPKFNFCEPQRNFYEKIGRTDLIAC